MAALHNIFVYVGYLYYDQSMVGYMYVVYWNVNSDAYLIHDKIDYC